MQEEKEHAPGFNRSNRRADFASQRDSESTQILETAARSPRGAASERRLATFSDRRIHHPGVHSSSVDPDSLRAIIRLKNIRSLSIRESSG